MSGGTDAMRDVYSKLDWAASRHDEMMRRFEEFAKPGGGEMIAHTDLLRSPGRPAGLVVAKFLVEEPMPVAMGLPGRGPNPTTREPRWITSSRG